MNATTCIAYPRVGLLGNPSDGYGGSTLGYAFSDFRTSVRLEGSDPQAAGPENPARVVVAAGRDSCVEAGSWRELVAMLPRRGGVGESLQGGAALQTAAVARFADHCAACGAVDVLDRAGFEASFESDIPRQVGLAGSSAIDIATLRALARRFEVPLSPFELSELALLAETEELSIAAGPQDRVIQAYQGLLFMDFSSGRSPDRYRRLETKLLPPMFVAYDPNPGVSSGKLHDDVRRRLEAGVPEVVEAIASFPRIAAEGVQRLEEGNIERFRELVDLNFDTRAAIWPLRDLDRELVAVGRAEGAAVKFSGSGGAVVGVLRDEGDAPTVARAYEKAGFRCLRPQVVSGPGELA